MKEWLIRVKHSLDLYRLAAITNSGHFFWILPFLPLLWVGFQSLLQYFNMVQPRGMEHVQGTLIGIPLTVLGIFLGLRIIAGEINSRGLEIVYTVSRRAAEGVALENDCVAAHSAGCRTHARRVRLVHVHELSVPDAARVVCSAHCSTCAWQWGAGALFRSEVGGAIATVAVVGLNGMTSGFGQNQLRLSPFFNPWAIDDVDSADLIAWTVQNRIIFVLLILALIGLAFMRSNRREKLLSA